MRWYPVRLLACALALSTAATPSVRARAEANTRAKPPLAVEDLYRLDAPQAPVLSDDAIKGGSMRRAVAAGSVWPVVAAIASIFRA